MDHLIDRASSRPVTRRQALTLGAALTAGGIAAMGTPSPVSAAVRAQATPVATPAADPGEAILDIVRDAMAQQSLNAVIVRVLVDGQEIVTAALGESMTGVPATTEMHFRNGAVAIAYMSTLLLRLVDRKMIGLDDTIERWLPDIPDADKVTFRMLANMTSGYPDFVQNADFIKAFYANPFRQFTGDEQIAYGLSTPRMFAPGTNWDYAHTNYVIMGRALEHLTGKSLDVLLQEEVLDPLGLSNTVAWSTPEITQPVLHAFSSERRTFVDIPNGVPFYEETTYWNPSWTLAPGAIQTSNIFDMAASAVAIGEGTLLTPASYQEMVAPSLIGFGAPLKGCPACHTLDTAYSFGLGVVLTGSWIIQTPLFGGYGAVIGYLPAQKIAIAVAVTFGEESFDDQGSYKYSSHQLLFRAIGAYLAPDDPPPAQGA